MQAREEGTTVESCDILADRDSDSDLSSAPSSPTLTNNGLPSPPLTQRSSNASPSPDTASSTTWSSSREDDGPPAKRRKITSPMSRKTAHVALNKCDAKPVDQQNDKDNERGQQLDRLVKALRKKRKIVVVAGAGISVSAGIPDFRSSTGLFKTLRSQHNLKSSGKALFDAAVYRDAPSTTSFHEMLRSLHTTSKAAKPTPFHHLLASLASQGRLLRLYTQNVDGIDTSLPPLATQSPLPIKGPWPKTIQVHGGLDNMVCTKCNEISTFRPELFDGPLPPECNTCREDDHVRTNIAGKRSHGIGRLRPRMVLYNEHNPDSDAIGAVSQADLRARPDAVIVIGTSLKIPGVRRIVRELCKVVSTRRDGLTAWVNTEEGLPTGKEFADCFDVVVTGTGDKLAELVDLKQWDEYDMDVGDVKEVSEEEVKLAQARSEPTVVIPASPRKVPAPAPAEVISSPPKKISIKSLLEGGQPVGKPKSKSKASGQSKLSFKITKVGANAVITKVTQ